MTERIRILIVEDRPTDAELMVLELEDEGFDPTWERVDTEGEYLEALAIGPDIILSDWRLPQFSGLHALRLLREQRLDIPFVIVSSNIGEEAAVDAVHGGRMVRESEDAAIRTAQRARDDVGMRDRGTESRQIGQPPIDPPRAVPRTMRVGT